MASTASTNGLLCFTNCLLPLEDGRMMEGQDLWIDVQRGVIVDAQRTFFYRKERPGRIIDLGGNILSPGFLDLQINGAYGFDFSVFDGDDDAYREGMRTVAEKIVETGVTSLIPTVVTQEKSLYPDLLRLLHPVSSPTSATLLGWHAEGPFLHLDKRGAHPSPFLLSAPEGFKSFETVYGSENLADAKVWLNGGDLGVRLITAAPEIPGVMDAVKELNKRGVVCSIGHSTAATDVAIKAVQNGARLITHLFNAMPVLHHRDPSIIGLLGAFPDLPSSFSPLASVSPLLAPHPVSSPPQTLFALGSEAFEDVESPPQSPLCHTYRSSCVPTPGTKTPHLDRSQKVDTFVRPFYGIIVDGIHSHPNSVRLAYSAHPDGCVLVTDAIKLLDPHLKDGVHKWRDGQYFVKEGEKVYLEGTNTLAGSVVTLDKCVRNFSRFTGCSLAQAIKCATYNPAKCLGIENKKGTLRPGADADMVVLDRTGVVLSTWVRGNEIWSSGTRD